MLTMQIYDQRIACHQEQVEKIKQSKANFQEYMDVHASLWNEEKFLNMKAEITSCQ